MHVHSLFKNKFVHILYIYQLHTVSSLQYNHAAAFINSIKYIKQHFFLFMALGTAISMLTFSLIYNSKQPSGGLGF